MPRPAKEYASACGCEYVETRREWEASSSTVPVFVPVTGHRVWCVCSYEYNRNARVERGCEAVPVRPPVLRVKAEQRTGHMASTTCQGEVSSTRQRRRHRARRRH